ncbi:MAG: glutamine amidotransferase-related protein [Promethearchaeati archaeon]
MSIIRKFLGNIKNYWKDLTDDLSNYLKRKKRIYIINNYPGGYQPERVIRLENIIRLNYPQINVRTIHYSDLEIKSIKKSIGLILTGSSLNVSSFTKNPKIKKKFQKEINLIKHEYKKPILAICFGHQLAAYAFGAEVKRMSYRTLHNDIYKLEINQSDELIPAQEVHVNLNHKDYVVPNDKNLSKYFNIFASLSINGYETVQYMRHKKKPIYSVQFHPENHIANYSYPPYLEESVIDEAKIAGQMIITNFISICL